MNILKKLKEIEEHFNNISEEQFENNLVKAGYGEIQHSNQSDMVMVCEKELERQVNDNKYTYSVKKKNYNFDKYPNTVNSIVEVA